MQVKTHHKGRLRQIPIYVGKFFRMFLYMDDWKVLPMAALISAVVALTVGKNAFLSMEGTLKGCLSLSCVCLWNGCFNSIQVVCRERDIVKREHRSGMHITSYIFSHMIYQAFLCLLQTGVTVSVCAAAGVRFPKTGCIFSWGLFEIAITFFLITYAADMMSLTVSCIARTTTAAMTIMPFILIFQLVFSSSMFGLSGSALKLTNLSIAKWGIDCLCSQGDYNSLPMVSGWQQLKKLENVEINLLDDKEAEMLKTAVQLYAPELADSTIIPMLEEDKPLKYVMKYLEDHDMKDDICKKTAEANQLPQYDKTEDNLKNGWLALLIISALFSVLSVIILKRIDKDRR